MNKCERKIFVLMHHASCSTMHYFMSDSLLCISYDIKLNQLFIQSPNTEAKLNNEVLVNTIKLVVSKIVNAHLKMRLKTMKPSQLRSSHARKQSR